MTAHPRVLFLCTGNACRSQMAEGWLSRLGGHRFRVLSAGTEPHGLDARATRAMAEVGVDISGHTSDVFDPNTATPAELVIAVCDRAASCCPELPSGTAFLCWPFPDPAAATGGEAEIAEEFRRVRDQIRDRVQAWLDSGAALGTVSAPESAAGGGTRPLSQR